jgi:hypothetical protein
VRRPILSIFAASWRPSRLSKPPFGGVNISCIRFRNDVKCSDLRRDAGGCDRPQDLRAVRHQGGASGSGRRNRIEFAGESRRTSDA